MFKNLTALALISALFSVNESDAASRPIRKTDRDNVAREAKFLGLNPSNDRHVRAYMKAPHHERLDRDYYVRLGLLPPLGGGAAAAAPGGPPIMGLHIDYGHIDSLRNAAPIILYNYGLPHKDDLYINATVDLLQRHRRIPTKAEIEALYDSRLTPFIRAINKLVGKIDRTSYDDLERETQAAVDSLPAEALNRRTVAASSDAQAVISTIKLLLDEQIDMLKRARNTQVTKTREYAKRDRIIALLYGGNAAFQDAASNTVPSMFEYIGAKFNEKRTLLNELDLKVVMANYKNELKRCARENLFPFIAILRLPAPAYTRTSPKLASTLLDRLTPESHGKINGLITKHLLPKHAGAILALLLKDRDTLSIFTDLDKFTEGKPEEVKKRARNKNTILNSLVTRQNQKTPPRPADGRGARADVTLVMDNLNDLLERAKNAGDR